MSRSRLLKRGRGNRLVLDIRALQRAIEDGTLTAGDQADILASFPELAGLVEDLLKHADRSRDINGRLNAQRRES